jgi:hypothetical protein
MIWRDVLFAVVWLIAALLPFAAAGRAMPTRRSAQALSLLLLALGVLLRPNAIFAAALLTAYVLWPARVALRRTVLVFLPAALGFAALVPAVYYGALNAKHEHPIQQFMVYDLGGITHFTGENQFPVEWTAPQTALLIGQCYSPVRWDVYWHDSPCAFVMQRLESASDPIFGTSRITQAWTRALLTHPLAYLEHRAAFAWNFLARPNLVLPYLDWDGPDAVYGSNPLFQPIRALNRALEGTIVFRAGVWLLLAIAIAAAAWPVRATPAGAFALGVNAAAAIYVMTFFAVGVASDFRYAYWCVLAVLAGAVALLLAWHERRRQV